MLNSGCQVGRGAAALNGVFAARVAGADDATAGDAAAGYQGAVTMFPVIAAGFVVDLGRAAEFANCQHQRLAE